MPVTSVSEGVSTLLPALVGALCPLGGRHWAGLFNVQKFLPTLAVSKQEWNCWFIPAEGDWSKPEEGVSPGWWPSPSGCLPANERHSCAEGSVGPGASSFLSGTERSQLCVAG